MYKELYISNKVGPLGHKRNNMKLYTQEQVIAIVLKSRETGLTADYLMMHVTPIELPNYKEQLDRIEQLLLKEEAAQRNRFTIGPL